MKFTVFETEGNGNCSFSSVYRAIHHGQQLNTNETLFMLFNRFMFAYAMMLRKKGPFNKFLTNSYFLAEDELCYYSLLFLNKFLIIFRNMHDDNNKMFIQPALYDHFIAYTNTSNILCLKCENSHYQYLQVEDGSVTFNLFNLSKSFKDRFLPFIKEENFKDISNRATPVCIQTTNDMSKLFKNQHLHPKVCNLIHKALLEDCLSFHIYYTTKEEYENLQQYVSTVQDMLGVRTNILLFLENTEKEVFGIVYGQFKKLEVPHLTASQLLHVLRLCIFKANLLDKMICLGDIASLQTSGDSVVVEFKRVPMRTTKRRIVDYIQERNKLLEGNKGPQSFHNCPKYNDVFQFLSRHQLNKHMWQKKILDSFEASENDLQLLDELYLRV